ncbi:MAG: helix-turn-helix transcriptional regulator [Saccharospirillum sp.]
MTMDPHRQQDWLIQLNAWWEGRVNTAPLMRYFGITRQAASQYLSRYRKANPTHLTYNANSKCYEPSEHFEPHCLSGDVSEYLNWLTGTSTAPADLQVPCHSIQHPPRNISPDIIRPLITALRENRRLDVDYLSVTSADTEGRVIAPHTLVNTGLRWHVRGWCEKSQGYRDFVLSRFRGKPELMDTSENKADHDTAWQTWVHLHIQPDPRLSKAKRQILAHDYQMTDGMLNIRTRAALAQYTLQDLQVNTKMLDGNPEAQQLVLANYDDVKQWLF